MGGSSAAAEDDVVALVARRDPKTRGMPPARCSASATPLFTQAVSGESRTYGRRVARGAGRRVEPV